MAAVLMMNVDAIVITGGMANSKVLCGKLSSYVGKIAPVLVLPGEAEMESLAKGAIRVLKGGKLMKY